MANLRPHSAQFVPRIVEDPTTQVMNFCRTPNWVLPKVSLTAYIYAFVIEQPLSAVATANSVASTQNFQIRALHYATA